MIPGVGNDFLGSFPGVASAGDVSYSPVGITISAARVGIIARLVAPSRFIAADSQLDHWFLVGFLAAIVRDLRLDGSDDFRQVFD